MSSPAESQGLVEHVLTKEEQAKLSPADVIAALKGGNARFVAGELTVRNHQAQIRKTATSQFPKAIVLSCIDSRIPVEDVFDRGIGDIFVARVAGNLVNTDILGSMEFACAVSGAKLILVLGHENCGAIKGAIDRVKFDNITPMLEKIHPAVDAVPGYEGARVSSNVEFVHAVTEENVRLNMARIRSGSMALAQMERDQEVAIVAAIYDMDEGRVVFLGV
ncbi:MAG: carbonic anhydrase family protein [Nitrospirota bacterium]